MMKGLVVRMVDMGTMTGRNISMDHMRRHAMIID